MQQKLKWKRLFLLSGCFIFQACPSPEKRQNKENRQRIQSPISVQIQDVQTMKRPRVVNSSVTLSPFTSVQVYPRVPGRLSYLGPTEGSIVKKGDLLFKVDRSDPGENFLETQIQSPISGYVGRWLMTLNSPITVQTPVVQIVDDQKLIADILLPSEEWMSIKQSTEIILEIEENLVKTKVHTLGRVADTATGKGLVQVIVDNSQRKYRAGLSAIAHISLDLKDRITIPASALLMTDEGAFVYLVENNKAKRISIQFQVLDNDTLDVVTGLAAGKKVIVSGLGAVMDGAPVQVVK